VTLTGLTWNTEIRLGAITFVDPFGGVRQTTNIGQNTANGPILIDNDDGLGHITLGHIVAAVSQSPIRKSSGMPESATLVLLGLGSFLIIIIGSFRSRSSITS